MQIFAQHPISWSLIALFLIFLAYTAWAIKREKKDFRQNSRGVQLKNYKFFVPHWWTQVGGEDDSSLIFERTDTRYDWRATWVWVPFDGEDREAGPGLKEVFAYTMREKGIVFDGDTSVVLDPTDFSQHPDVHSQKIQVLRVEGTATQEEIHRLYYDAVLIKDLEQEGYLFAESKSSVLNGMVEGPYFEEAMLNFERQV